MPDAILEVVGVTAHGTWGGQPTTIGGTLVLDDRSAFIDSGAEVRTLLALYSAITDATWQRETLTLYSGESVLTLSGPRELNRAWAVVMERACALPEMTRGLRSLGTTRGGSAELQARFFGPLLTARRRLQSPDALEWRVSQFDAVALTERLTLTVRELALERYPERAPDRRALEAELSEALEPLVATLETLARTTEEVHVSVDGQRFVAWRHWTRQLRRVFLEADRAWSSMARSLQQAP